jgi:hypothetical protein
MVTSHGRATPLVWKTVRTADLKGRRASHEDEALSALFNRIDSARRRGGKGNSWWGEI